MAHGDLCALFMNADLTIREATPAMAAQFGVARDDLGRPIGELRWPFAADSMIADARAAARDGATRERDLEPGENGRSFLCRVSALRARDGRPDGCLLSLRDVTDRKASHLRLAEQYSELETLYAKMPVGLSLIDRDRRWIRINEKLAAINGFTPAEHIGKRQEDLIPELDAKVAQAQMRVLESGESVLGAEVRGATPANPDDERIWLVDYFPVAHRGEVFAVGTCMRDVTEQRRMRGALERSLEALEESGAQLRRIFDAAPALITVSEGPDHRYLYVNECFRAMTGLRGVIGEPIRTAFPEAADSEAIAVYDNVYGAGESIDLGEKAVTFRHGDGVMRTSYFRQLLRPWFREDGSVGGVLNFSLDISDLVRARNEALENERHRTLLLRELQHRVKNTLATTLAIVRFSAARAKTIDAFTRSLRARLMAIARTHDVLSKTDWKGDSLSNLVLRELAPYIAEDSERLALRAPKIALSSKQALAMSLAFHELATNASKHGALSNDAGRIEVNATCDAAGRCRIDWRERGGPRVTEPAESQTGFGDFLLRQILAQELQGRCEMLYAEGGVEYHIEFDCE